MTDDTSEHPATQEAATGAEWRAFAACRRAEPSLFFPLDRIDAGPGKLVCVGCPVRVTCQTWAFGHEEHGTWGGLDEWERRKAANTRRRDGLVRLSVR